MLSMPDLQQELNDIINDTGSEPQVQKKHNRLHTQVPT